MKNKLTNFIGKLYGWGIFVVLFAGGLTAIAFVVAMIIGGDTGSEISVFVQKKVFAVLIYATSILVLLGLVRMYLKGEKSLVMDASKRKQKK